jgi:hypothetical protein
MRKWQEIQALLLSIAMLGKLSITDPVTTPVPASRRRWDDRNLRVFPIANGTTTKWF